MGRMLIGIGLALVVLGLLWPLLGKLGLGRLPGDLVIRRPGFTLYAPLVTGLLLSVVGTVLVNVVLWLMRRR